jgi:hypothetical protein
MAPPREGEVGSFIHRKVVSTGEFKGDHQSQGDREIIHSEISL